MKNMVNIIGECKSCNGTGLYSGFAEAKGEAVVCLNCNGQGWKKISVKCFSSRKKKKGIKTIRVSKGDFILTGVGGEGPSMTYEQFEKKYKEKIPK